MNVEIRHTSFQRSYSVINARKNIAYGQGTIAC